jgi:Tol biopolymer transport system component
LAGNNPIQERLRAGIEAVKRGDKTNAQRLLRQVLDSEPRNEVAWMWLASALDNLQDRKQALEQVLKINPNNERAQNALGQINQILGVGPSRRISRQGQPARRGGDSGNLGLIIAGALLAVLILGIIIFNVVSRQAQPPIPDPATQQALLASSTPTATIDPALYTPTPFYGVIVTPRDLPTLPPSFTPTFTPTVATSTPTPTPYPLSLFSVLYTSRDSGETQAALYQMNGEGTGDQQVGPAAAGYSDVVYSPNQRLVAFVRTVTYQKDGQAVTSPELFVAPADNLAAARQVTQIGGESLSHPSWAPDSVQLVFAANFDGDDDLFIVTEDGNNLRPITSNDFADRDPAWSPDGSTIIYASEQANGPGTGLTELFSMTPDGTEITQLTDAEGSSYTPAWSPDGKLVVFASDRGGDGDIFTMEPSGQALIRITVNDGNAEDRIPVFTPNGQAIVFASNGGDGETFQLYISDLRGASITRLSDPGRDVQSLTFRPEPLLLPPQ